MRIGFDAKRAFRNFTGLGNYSRATISILSDFYPANQYFLYTPFYKKHPLLSFAHRPNITVRGPEGFLKRIPSAWRSLGVADDIRFDKIQLFHGLTGELPWGIGSKTRAVVTIHDLIFLRYPEYYKPFDRWIYTRKYKSACERADLVIAISEQTKLDVMEFFGIDEQKIRLVYQGCEAQFYRTVTEVEKRNVSALYRLPEKYVLYVGTIEERKNLATLVKALSLLPDEVHLVAVGHGMAYCTKVKEEIESRKLSQRVLFLHSVAFNHLPAIYQQAQVFCLPSLFEGFGIPVLEALNSRVPVVTSNISSLPEAGGPSGLYVTPTDETAIASAIRRVLDDDALRRRMIDGGLKHAALFHEQSIAQNMWSVYSELLP
ncbi:MAG: glycosyltransferase family 4 protein [Prevotellaceae bacterium]|jgi:glycosyltransferase involved in cell wall biosynthesis|nr:glycosyltransferase family 4 protein [Prevotellaceae bacterium]